MKRATTREPRMRRAVAIGIRALAKPGVATALLEGTAHPNAAPDVKPDDVALARAALAFAKEWSEWKRDDEIRKAKALRARARKLLAGVDVTEPEHPTNAERAAAAEALGTPKRPRRKRATKGAGGAT